MTLGYGVITDRWEVSATKIRGKEDRTPSDLLN